jgi:hypothetical protein
MAEKLIQDSTLTAIANAIRSKTGYTEPITVTDMASQIEAISGGGGGDHTIKFMSEDGSTVLCEKAVMNGDTSGDPVSLGLIDIPTKEATAEFNYGFWGWSLTPGGEADENALVNITSDKTVYASFVGVVRLYTIKYYDEDSVIHKETLAYGATPSYTPEKSGYVFTGWTPSVVEVTGDADYYANWDSSLVLVVDETAFDATTIVDGMGCYREEVAPADYTEALTVGNTYRVIWDGVSYDCVARKVDFTFANPNGSTDSSFANAIGNAGIVTRWMGYKTSYKYSDVTNDPFFMYRNGSSLWICSKTTNHTLKIYKM